MCGKTEKEGTAPGPHQGLKTSSIQRQNKAYSAQLFSSTLTLSATGSVLDAPTGCLNGCYLDNQTHPKAPQFNGQAVLVRGTRQQD